MDGCLFCKIIAGEIPAYTVYEDDLFKVILDRFPSSVGHTLILPKSHCEGIFDLPPAEGAALMPLASKLARALKEALSCEGMNLLQNNGAVAGQTVNHFHLHLIPRYEGDGIRVGWDTVDPQEDQFRAMMDKIRL